MANAPGHSDERLAVLPLCHTLAAQAMVRWPLSPRVWLRLHEWPARAGIPD